MKFAVTGMCCIFLLITACPLFADPADDATSQLFNLLGEGGCEPIDLTKGAWTINTMPMATHGELIWGDLLVFEQLGPAKSISRKSKFNVWRNGALWISTSGWTGSCMRNGNLSVYVVRGEVELDGCLHELAIGRLNHNDSLKRRIEIVFRDRVTKQGEHCGHSNLLHPGHAHGVG